MYNLNAISIVIPAFNAETTLPDLVQDCISQTVKNVEVICVDDGSDDGTLACIEELSRKHASIRAISIEHGGPTAARSAGADAARGEWIIFADADDRVEPTWIESLAAGIDPHGKADIIAGASCWRRGSMPSDNQISSGLFPSGPCMDEIWKRMLGSDASISHSMCDKLFRIDLARNVFSGIDRSVRIGEDTWFNIVAFARARAVAVTNAAGYIWNDTQGSLSYTQPIIALQDYKMVYAHVKKELLAHGEYATTLWRDWMNTLVENQLRLLLGNKVAAEQIAARFMASYEEAVITAHTPSL